MQAIADVGGEALGAAAHEAGLALLVARPGDLAPGALAAALAAAGANDIRSAEVGSHAIRFTAPNSREA